MTQDKFIIKNGAVIESVLAGETVFDVQKTDKSSILGINSDGTINLIGNVNPSGNFTNKLKITNGGISVAGVSKTESIFTDVTGGTVLKGINTGDQDLGDLSTYGYVDNTFLKLTGGTMTGSLYVNDTTNSSSTTTGAIRTSGGLGVVGNAYFGGTVTAPTFVGNLTGNASTATRIEATVSGTNTIELVRGNMDSDQFRILVGATANNAGYVEIATADDGTEPIYVRQYSGVFTSLVRTATLLDEAGNTSFPGTVTASKFNAGYDSGVPNSINCSAWFRSSNATGWYNETYNGGIYMEDTTYVRIYANKAFKVTSTASDSINTDGGVLASGDINVSGVVGFGTNKCQMLYNSTENSIDFIIN